MGNLRQVIPIPTVRDDQSGYNYLSKLAQAIISNPDTLYTFDFSKCSTISHNGLVVIGGICNYLKQYESTKGLFSGFGLPSFFAPIKVAFSLEKMNSVLLARLKTLGFWNYVSPDHGVEGVSDYIGYREHETVLEDAQIIGHLQDSWLTGEKLLMSDSLKAEIVSSIYEIFVNAYGHGLKDNPNNQSVISCGYYEPKEKKLSLSVLDFGGGIVKAVTKHTAIKDKRKAFEWALTVGNSTRTDSPPDIPRGLGFGILKDFISVNGGSLKICSDSFIATVDLSGNFDVSSIPGYFSGTLVSITVNCDNKYYRFKSEATTKAPNYF